MDKYGSTEFGFMIQDIFAICVSKSGGIVKEYHSSGRYDILAEIDGINYIFEVKARDYVDLCSIVKSLRYKSENKRLAVLDRSFPARFVIANIDHEKVNSICIENCPVQALVIIEDRTLTMRINEVLPTAVKIYHDLLRDLILPRTVHDKLTESKFNV